MKHPIDLLFAGRPARLQATGMGLPGAIQQRFPG
jgi:hypothetical protein